MIDQLPAADAWALLRWWRDHPPAHEILAAAFRPAAAVARPVDPADPSNIGALLARFPDGKVPGD